MTNAALADPEIELTAMIDRTRPDASARAAGSREKTPSPRAIDSGLRPVTTGRVSGSTGIGRLGKRFDGPRLRDITTQIPQPIRFGLPPALSSRIRHRPASCAATACAPSSAMAAARRCWTGARSSAACAARTTIVRSARLRPDPDDDALAERRSTGTARRDARSDGLRAGRASARDSRRGSDYVVRRRMPGADGEDRLDAHRPT